MWFMLDTNNPFFLLLKLPNKDWFGTSVFLGVGYTWILICGNWESIVGEKDGETMGSTPY